MSFTPTPTEGDDIIQGDSAPDVIDALGGNDRVFGGGGGDSIQGGPGNDSLTGSLGDTLLGGTGDDLYGVMTYEAVVIELPGEGYDTVMYRDDDFVGTLVQPLNVELMVLVGYFNDIVGAGNAQDNHIRGNNTGDDTIYGMDGNDTIEGDWTYYYGSNSWSSWTGNDVLYGGNGDDLLYGDRGSPGSGSGNDTLYGEAGNDTLYGADGTDELYGGEGNDLLGFGDLLSGGAGDDTYLFARYSGFSTVVEAAVAGEANVIRVENLEPGDVALTREGNDLVLSAIAYQFTTMRVKDYFGVTVAPVARVEFASGAVWDASVLAAAPAGLPPFDLFVVGTEESDYLQGGAGSDTIDGRGGDDQIEGHGGNDYLLGGPGRDGLQGGPGDDYLDGGIELDYLIGDAGNDTLIGDEGTDYLTGGEGNDSMVGGEGNDIFVPGPGDDVIDPGSGSHRIVFQSPSGNDVIRATPVSTNEYIDGTTLELANYFGGSPGQPEGLRPDQVELSRDGVDLVLGIPSASASITVEGYFAQAEAGQYPQILVQWHDYVEWRNADILAAVDATQPPPPGPTPATGTDAADTLTGTAGADVLLGRAGNDLLQGGDGNDFLNGETGADTLVGGAGDDVLVVDDAADVVTEAPYGGVDEVQSYVDYRLPRQVENLTLIGDIARVGTGNAFANVLMGNDADNALFGRSGNDLLLGNRGNDFLDGGPGADSMFGGPGDDTVVVNDPGDVIGEEASEGVDTVQSYIDFVLPGAHENLILIGRWAEKATGNSLANVIIGNAADNVIDGAGGLDSLSGGRGDDVFILHGGLEQVDGGAGADTLRFGSDLASLALAGKAGVSLRGIEAIDMTNGVASVLTMTVADVAALGLDRPLRISGETGDELALDAGWTEAGRQGAYDRYVNDDLVLLVGVDVAVQV